MPVSTSNKNNPQQIREDLHAMLLSSVSHDLKTPLACIIGSLDIYQHLKDTLSEERKDSLIIAAIKEARRLDSFITNILDMARLESDKAFKYERIDIGQLVRQCVLKMDAVLNQHDVKLELASQVMVDVNELWIARAVTLLLDNAALYTPVNTQILVTVTSDQLACWVAVRDFGPGIPKKIVPALFHKHSRTTQEDTKTAGTGLGLPICKAIAEMHGGAIRCEEAASGDGTVFTITLPVIQKKQKHKEKLGN